MNYDILGIANALIDELFDYTYGNKEIFYRVIQVFTQFPILPSEMNLDFGFEEDSIKELLLKLKEQNPDDYKEYKELLKEKRNCELKL